ncbi:MAG: GGDEF domain-containing phosphodiesterase [Pseudomonadota bacterium]
MTTSYSHCHGLIRLTGLGQLLESLGRESCRILLEEFESRLNVALRADDRMLKVSEGKYCIILNNVTERHHAELAAAKIERVLEPAADIIGQRISFSAVIGMALPQGQVSGKKLLQIAETALRRAYSAGQTILVLSPDEAGKVEQPDVALVPRLEEALQQGEFVLYYQPKIDARYNQIVGAEALVRWHDVKRKKVIPPGVFIERVERSAMIQPFTEHLLRAAIAKCATWTEPLSVAVNVAPSLLETTAFIDVVRDSLEFFSVGPHRLTLEITERGELPRKALAHLEQIRATGVKISIDDFGTGQCSLSYFRDLPADQIKIDQSFVQAMTTSRKDRAIVHSCIELAHDCGIEVVAEGIEDEATVEALSALGCDILQGFWFGKPQPEAEFEQEHLNGLTESRETDHFSDLLASGD